jgi:hypothetical protein
MPRRLKLVLEASVWMMDRREDGEVQPELGRFLFVGWVRPDVDARTLSPETADARAVRGIAGHLKHQGSSFGTREPRFERRVCEARQAAKSSDVSNEGRSLRSSRGAGKPRTWRRETVGA